MGESVVAARALTKSFGQFVAVDGIDFEVQPGEVFGFLGPNGAGKSSTMRMIGAVSPRSAGSLRVFGADPEEAGPEIRARLGVVPQQDNLDGELSVEANLMIYGRYFDIPRKVLKARTTELLEFAQLADRRKDRVEPLSGGMKRRLTIARALINEPDMVLLDEPTTGLDPQARHLLWERLNGLRRAGVTLVITTHYMDEAEQLCDRLVVMDQGKIVAAGSPAALIQQHTSGEVVEVRVDLDEVGRQQIANVLAHHADRVEVLSDRVVLSTSDARATEEAVRRAGVAVDHMLVRRSTLEDVFLALTGRTLID